MQNGDFNEIREILKNIVILHRSKRISFFNTPKVGCAGLQATQTHTVRPTRSSVRASCQYPR